MSQNDFTIANQGFPAFRADLNSALQALASNSSGATEPSTMFANMWWYDTSNNIMYIRNEDNDAWIKFAELDQTNDKFVLSGTLQLDDGTVSAPALTFNSDTNMGIYRGGTDILKFVTAGTDAITIDASQNTTFAGIATIGGLTVNGTGNVVADFNTTNSNADITLDNTSYGVRLRTNNAGGFSVMPADTTYLNVGSNGDISFYEDTGTTPKLFWNATTEQLGIGITSLDNTYSSSHAIQIASKTDNNWAGTLMLTSADGSSVFSRLVASTSGFDLINTKNTDMRFFTNNTQRMHIDNNGNLNVGVPTADTSSNNISITGGLAGNQLNAQLKFFGKSVSNTGVTYETARISGGSTSGSYSLSGGLVFSTSSNNGSNVLTLAQRMWINDLGNVGIGASPISGQRLYVVQNTNNTVCQISNTDTAGFTSDALFIYNTRTTSNSTYNHISAFNGSFTNGFIVRDSGNAENTNDSYGPIASDERLKQDIVDCGEQWNDLKNLRIRKFRYRNNPQGHLQIGCIAQEAEQISPNLISRRVPTKHEILVNPDLGNLVDDLDRPIEDEEGNITGYEQKVETDTEVLSFKSSVLFWKATKALQEAMTRIETLETTNTALEARITALENGE